MSPDVRNVLTTLTGVAVGAPLLLLLILALLTQELLLLLPGERPHMRRAARWAAVPLGALAVLLLVARVLL